MVVNHLAALLKNMATLIAKYNTVVRGQRTIAYPFKTYDTIFGDTTDVPPNLRLLMSYLRWAFVNEIPERAATVTSAPQLVVDTQHARNDRLNRLAELSGYQGQGNKQHDVLQALFLKESQYCIATELPVYDDEYTGRIDILEYFPEDDTIGLWDFKPNAAAERKAASQLLRYVTMLSALTKINHRDIKAGYFDEKNTYNLVY